MRAGGTSSEKLRLQQLYYIVRLLAAARRRNAALPQIAPRSTQHVIHNRARIVAIASSTWERAVCSICALPVRSASALCATARFPAYGPLERHVLAGPFRQRRAKGDEGLFEPGGAALALAQRPERSAKFVLRRGYRRAGRHPRIFRSLCGEGSNISRPPLSSRRFRIRLAANLSPAWHGQAAT